MGLETNFQSTVLKYLNGLPDCKAENVSGNANQSGRPDINGCYKGRAFKLELKSSTTGYTTSRKQKLELRRWANAGCVVGVIYSMTTLRFLFEKSDWCYGIQHFELDDGSWFTIPNWRELWPNTVDL